MDNFFGITKMSSGKTRLFTAENVYGEKGKGGMAKLSSTPQPEVEKIGQIWGGPYSCGRDLGEKWKLRPSISLEPNVETSIVDIEAQGKITHIWITTHYTKLRDVIIRMYWDNEENPSVLCPVGDFFCNGFSKHININSIPINVNPTGGMNCYFPMPFRKHARITVENRGPELLHGFFYAVSMEEGKVEDDEAYFHASFRRENPTKYMQDYTIIDGIKGKGHYVGTHMGWQQNTQGWWGEGEIKAFIDGDGEYPTYCGTGTEDYFGGAWSFMENYSAPFLGYQDMMAEGAYGEKRNTNTVGNRHNMYRFHIMDPIRFETDFKVTMQALGWRSEGRYLPLKDDISSCAYWYQSEPHNKFKQLQTRDEIEVI